MKEQSSFELFEGGHGHGDGHGSAKESEKVDVNKFDVSGGPSSSRNLMKLLFSFNLCSLMCFDKYES
jgi:hypothetical protein